MWHTFLDNMLIIVGFFYISFQLNDFGIKKNISSKLQTFIHALLGGVLSIIVMSFPFTYEEMSIDLRSVPIFTISYMYGATFGLICCILPFLFRLFIGGAFVFQGIFLGILSPMLIGSLFHRNRKIRAMNKTIRIQKILFAYFVYTIVKALFMFSLLPLSYKLLFKLIMSMTILSSIAIYCILLLVNNYTNKKLFMKEIEANNQKLTSLSQQHLSTLETLYKKNEELHTATMAKDKFIANISHELKTPLNITMTYIEYLLEEEGPLNDLQKKFLNTAYTNAERLQYLINDLLDLSLLDTMTIKLNYEYINITDFIKIIAQERDFLLKDTPLHINTTVPNRNIFIMADPFRLRQVMDNLLDNAIKFSEEGSIQIILKEEKHHIEIQINDCGIGIPSTKINNIFNPFYQVDHSSKKKYEGAGLGLSIAKKLITACGGNISVTSDVHKGSSFKIIIPFTHSCKETIHEKNIYH
ncbi:MAG: HAMP domain-containing histidine kinase [Marinisporobacter sp.]|nr:HAMP domain-containing histidine kinase [Marinisporobacter sp.]